MSAPETAAAWPLDDGEALVPAIVQDAETLQVLMLGYVNRAAYERTLELGRMTFFSRSRGRLWTKGETSGNTLDVARLAWDCDGDTLLVRARPAGPTCHRGTTSCFGAETAPGLGFLGHLARTVRARRDADAERSYTARLFEGGLPRIAQKVGEEGVETVIAALGSEPGELVSESADLLFHLLVLWEASGVAPEAILDELRRRHAPA